MSIVLSSRLEKALALLPPSLPLIDVGADHGFFSLSASKEGRKVYAVENKVGPYHTLKENLSEYPRYPVEAILADGFEVLPSDVRAAALLGMGGKTIEGILSAYPEKLSQLDVILIEPQSLFSLPITYLVRHGYTNDSGEMILEKRYYPLLRFVKGKEEASEAGLKYGSYLVKKKDPLLKEYLLSSIHALAPFEKQAEKKRAFEEDYKMIYGVKS